MNFRAREGILVAQTKLGEDFAALGNVLYHCHPIVLSPKGKNKISGMTMVQNVTQCCKTFTKFCWSHQYIFPRPENHGNDTSPLDTHLYALDSSMMTSTSPSQTTTTFGQVELAPSLQVKFDLQT